LRLHSLPQEKLCNSQQAAVVKHRIAFAWLIAKARLRKNLICSAWSFENETMKMVGRTHSGLQRMRNEDALGFDTTRAIAVVADGMGGLMAGARPAALLLMACLNI